MDHSENMPMTPSDPDRARILHAFESSRPAPIICRMRQIGKRIQGLPAFNPEPAALRWAAVHQRAGAALAAVSTTGILKGIYRFSGHADMNRHADQALAMAIAANIRQRSIESGQR